MRRSFTYYQDLLVALTNKELKVRYQRSLLGYLWSVANPLAMALIFFVAFKIIMRVDIPNYTLFLIAGLFPWQWFSNSVNASTMIFVSNASLIKKINFNRESLVIAVVLNDMIHFILSVPVIVIFMIFYGIRPNPGWILYLPLLLLIQLVLTFGVAIAVAAINLFFRDLERIVGILTVLLFYATPILYPADMVPAEYRALILLNPAATLVLGWRSLFMNTPMDFSALGLALLYSLMVLAAGYAVFHRLKWRFAEVL
ncbi:MAG: ABC transporter permease [Thermodesulfovibrionales bacterium]